MPAGEVEAFFDKLARAYSAAEDACGAVARSFRIGEQVVELRFAGPALVTPLGSALAHLGCTASGPADLTVCLFDSASTATPPPPRPWTNEQVREGGLVEDFSNARFHTVYQVAARLLTVLDRDRRRALCWTPDAGDLAMPERAAPLRRLLQAWTADRGTLLVHGGAVGRSDGGVLVVGQGGAGKSTTALACLRSPLQYAADDYCLLDPGPRPWVHSLYGTGKTDVSGLARLPFLAPMVSNRDRGVDEKALCSLHDHVPGALTTGFPLRAVLVPRLTRQPTTTIAPSSPGAMLHALAPTTVLLSPQTAARVLPVLADLARRVPVYELAVGEDAATIPAAIVDLLDAMRAEEGTRRDRDPVPPGSHRRMTPTPAPLISVVIPVHNGELYLAEAADSALAQTYRPVEVVVVDDGSTDRTAEVAAGLGMAVRYVHQRNRGPGGAMNRGVALARGEYVAFLSADDVWAADKLTGQMAALVADPSLDLVFGHVQQFLSPELDDEVARTLHCPPDPMPACSAGTLLTRLETFRRVGNFDEQWRVGEFFDWYARARDLGLRERVLPAVVSRRRVHGGNLSHRTDAPATGYARVLKATLDRRRRQAGSDGSASCD